MGVQSIQAAVEFVFFARVTGMNKTRDRATEVEIEQAIVAKLVYIYIFIYIFISMDLYNGIVNL